MACRPLRVLTSLLVILGLAAALLVAGGSPDRPARSSDARSVSRNAASHDGRPAIVAGTAGSIGLASAQPARDAASELPTSGSAIDHELHQALHLAGLAEEWLAASPVSDQASYLRIDAGAGYAAARDELLGAIAALTVSQTAAADRLERARALDVQLAMLEQVLAGVDAAFDARSSDPAEHGHQGTTRAGVTLAAMIEPLHQLGFSLESLSIAERHAHVLVSQLSALVEELSADEPQAHTTLQEPHTTLQEPHTTLQEHRETLSELVQQLAEVQSLSNSARTQTARELAATTPDRDALVATFSEIHADRLLGATAVDDLPLVTLDAYLRGAQDLGACPVDWSLLAGIGRVESRHGTLDDSSVGTSGRLTVSIYGPLLDGGATEREAEEALALAEAEALAAELEAVAEEAGQMPDPALWGEPEPEEEADPIDPLYGHTEPDDDEIDPLYGDLYLLDPDRPRLEDPDEAGSAENEDDDDSAEGEDDEPQGNGFAVIEDTDNGQLDGNDRWDRAVGPMQFIPETWGYWGTDGNGDGVVDAQNIYDAARSAGEFLCDLSRRRGPSPSSFVLGYNASDSYVRAVLSFAASYGSIDVTPPDRSLSLAD